VPALIWRLDTSLILDFLVSLQIVRTSLSKQLRNKNSRKNRPLSPWARLKNWRRAHLRAGEDAEKLIPKIHTVIENYKFRAYGDYSSWPGPNSNTFVQAVLDAVPELKAVLPPTAIGKDYPYHGDWFGPRHHEPACMSR
jgi:hypothetical protein